MSSNHHLKGIQKSSLTDKIRNAIYVYKRDNPTVSQKDLQAWVKQKFDMSISQPTISNTLKRSAEYLSNEMKDSDYFECSLSSPSLFKHPTRSRGRSIEY